MTWERVEQHHGSNTLEGLFPEGTPTGRLHPSGQRRYDRGLVRDAVRSVLRGESHPEQVDPRYLHMTQSAITRAGTEYYLHNETHEKTGETYADKDKPGNAVPIIHESLTAQGVPHRQILSGHHRAAAAVLAGRPLTAIVVREH